MARENTLRELRELSRTLQTGIPAQGQGRLAAAGLLNTQAKDRFQMDRQTKADARQTEMDALVKPGLELERDKAQGEIDRRKNPVTLTSLTGGNLWQMGHMVSAGKGKGDEKPMISELAEAYGAKFDADKKSPTYGKMVRQDGSMVTHGDFDDNPELAQSIVLGNTDYKRSVRDIVEQIDVHGAAMKGKFKREGLSDEEMVEMQKIGVARGKAVNFLNSPRLQIEANDNQIEWLSKFRGPGWEKGVARIEKKNDYLWKEHYTKIVAGAKALTSKASEKDNRSPAEKLMDYYAKYITGGDKAKAIEIFRSDKFIEEKLRVYAEELKGMQNSMEWMNMPTEDKAEAIEDLQIRLELKPRPGATPAPVGGRKEMLTGQENDNDPWGIR